MTVTTAIAIYAALVATGAAAWPVFQWHHARKSHVTVSVSYGMLAYPDAPLEDAVIIRAISRTDRQVRVESAGLNAQDGSQRVAQSLHMQPGATIPGTIAPHDSGWTYILASELKREFDFHRPVVAWVALATGERVHSKPAVFLKR